MKIALITDSHFGARSESMAFNDFFFKFWESTFFPYIEKHDIKNIIHLGDVVDRRKFMNYVIMNSMRTRFIDRIGKIGCHMDVIVGNHDVPYRNTNTPNAIEEMFGSREYINVISGPITKIYDGLPIAIIPWINSSNHQDTLDLIKNTPANIAMGHLEISGFEMDKGNIINTGMDRDTFKKFETVYSGHFHHKSTDGHIFYLGNLFEITWSDYNDKRGFHVFDTDTRSIEFIENPHHMFHKLEYDDTVETIESVEEKDFAHYHNNILKVIVKKKTNPVLFDQFMEKLYSAQPLDIAIVEDFIEYNELSEDDIIDQADSTTTIVDKYIDSIDMGLDRDKLKNLMREIYNQAQNLESSQ